MPRGGAPTATGSAAAAAPGHIEGDDPVVTRVLRLRTGGLEGADHWRARATSQG